MVINEDVPTSRCFKILPRILPRIHPGILPTGLPSRLPDKVKTVKHLEVGTSSLITIQTLIGIVLRSASTCGFLVLRLRGSGVRGSLAKILGSAGPLTQPRTIPWLQFPPPPPALTCLSVAFGFNLNTEDIRGCSAVNLTNANQTK
jgi:hypothetical protein